MADGWSVDEYGGSPWGAAGDADLTDRFEGRLNCWPLESGSLVILANDGNIASRKQLVDDGDGNLVGDGVGEIRYDYGHFWFRLSYSPGSPLPALGTKVYASYTPVEGGCAEECSKCATNKIRLDVTPGTIAGQSDTEVYEAWSRLFAKIEKDVLPIHVELVTEHFSEYFLTIVGNRFDILASDEHILDDGDGLKTEFGEV